MSQLLYSQTPQALCDFYFILFIFFSEKGMQNAYIFLIAFLDHFFPTLCLNMWFFFLGKKAIKNPRKKYNANAILKLCMWEAETNLFYSII